MKYLKMINVWFYDKYLEYELAVHQHRQHMLDVDVIAHVLLSVTNYENVLDDTRELYFIPEIVQCSLRANHFSTSALADLEVRS